jgi:hypothetical protein
MCSGDSYDACYWPGTPDTSPDPFFLEERRDLGVRGLEVVSVVYGRTPLKEGSRERLVCVVGGCTAR